MCMRKPWLKMLGSIFVFFFLFTFVIYYLAYVERFSKITEIFIPHNSAHNGRNPPRLYKSSFRCAPKERNINYWRTTEETFIYIWGVPSVARLNSEKIIFVGAQWKKPSAKYFTMKVPICASKVPYILN